MLMSLDGDPERRIRALEALRHPDESRDDILRKFVRLASQALNIPGSFISIIDDEFQYVRASHNFKLERSSRGGFTLSLCGRW